MFKNISWKNVFKKEAQILFNRVNMVRAGAVDHPEQWIHSGYSEIQSSRRKCILIDYDALRQLSGFNEFESFQLAHRHWIQDAISKTDFIQESKWTKSIAVGSEPFLAKIKKQMNASAMGRRIRHSNESCELREAVAPYNSLFEAQKIDIDVENTWFWNKNLLISN